MVNMTTKTFDDTDGGFKHGLMFFRSSSKEGGILMCYSSEGGDRRLIYDLCETVPSDVVALGKDAVVEYAMRKVADLELHRVRLKNAASEVKNYPIATKYKDGTLLEGAIVSIEGYDVDLELQSPVHRLTSFDAKKVTRYFDEDYRLSTGLISYAKKTLIRLYEYSINPIDRMIDELNDGIMPPQQLRLPFEASVAKRL